MWPSGRNGDYTWCSCSLSPYACPLCVSCSLDPLKMSPDDMLFKSRKTEIESQIKLDFGYASTLA